MGSPFTATYQAAVGSQSMGEPGTDIVLLVQRWNGDAMWDAERQGWRGSVRDGRVVMVAFWKAGRRGTIHWQTYRYAELSEGVHLGFLAPGLWAVVGAGGRMGAKIRCESVRVLW